MCLAIPGKVLTSENRGGVRVGRVQFGGITRETCLDFVPEAQVGDYVIVHVGFAISRVDAEEAKKSFELLESMGLLQEELGPETEIS
ncbi:MAG: HypC/HybG/HupF family hydrogenase formation chaperone [Acidobacteriia bacterium]|nr:HypC/HybG/HupF family hydrogenase formation chaperone [Terriglobia bacterium]